MGPEQTSCKPMKRERCQRNSLAAMIHESRANETRVGPQAKDFRAQRRFFLAAHPISLVGGHHVSQSFPRLSSRASGRLRGAMWAPSTSSPAEKQSAA